jgi:acyl-CoA thioesterase-1
MRGGMKVKSWLHWGAIGMCLLPLVACGPRAAAPSMSSAESQPSQANVPAAAPSATEASATEPIETEPITIVAVGDSLTEGMGVEPEEAYPAQLERKLLDAGYSVTVINAGSSGETSSGLLSRVDWVLRLEPDIVILATGGNDGLRGIEPQVTAENIDALIERFRASGAVVVLAGMEMVQNMGREYTDAFRAIYPAAAEAHDVPFIPFLLEGVAADPSLNQPDFIHPTGQGYAVVAETVYPYIVQAIEQVQARQTAP